MDGRGPVTYCPFRVFKQEHPAVLMGQGTITTEEFYKCMGKECAAFYPGGCLRLAPPALVVDGDHFTDADLEKLRKKAPRAQIIPNPEEPPEPQPSCSTCANYETKNGCGDCIFNPANRFRKETMPSNWEPKEVPW